MATSRDSSSSSSSSDSSFEKFLTGRNVAPDTLRLLRDEKVDSKIIAAMSDAELVNFFPKTGDRVSIREYCKKKKTNLYKKISTRLVETENEKPPKRQYTRKSKRIQRQSLYKRKSSSNAEKPTRKIQIGWIVDFKDGKGPVRVRSNTGGGTRELQVDKNLKAEDIIRKGLHFFFPAGRSSRGLLSKFDITLTDAVTRPYDTAKTVQELYNEHCCTMLKFYIYSIKKDDPQDCSNATNTIGSSASNLNDQSNTQFGEPSSTLLYSTSQPVEEHIETSYHSSAIDYSYIVGSTIGASGSNLDITLEDSIARILLPSQPETISNNPYTYHNVDSHGEIDQIQNENEPTATATICVHRGLVFEDLNKIFKDLNIAHNIVVMVKNTSGEFEGAVDTGGVFRDILTEYCNTFYQTCSVGTDFKVPFIRHDFTENKWQCVAKILKKGWTQLQYFPIKFAAPFLEMCCLGRTQSNLTSVFYRFVSKYEREILQKAIDNFENVEYDDLLEVMSNLDCRTSVTKENLKDIIEDIAHKEIIQKPMFIIDCWRDVLNGLISCETLNSIYQNSVLSYANIMRLLEYEDHLSADDSKVLLFLKKYLREADENHLSLLLRFWTGADVLLEHQLVLRFNDDSGFKRTPTARTCTFTLFLPNTYESFPEFRAELNNVLESRFLEMDFV